MAQNLGFIQLDSNLLMLRIGVDVNYSVAIPEQTPQNGKMRLVPQSADRYRLVVHLRTLL
jgi:hypothetical protein